MRTEEEIKAILEETTRCKAQRLTKKPIGHSVYYEWAIVNDATTTVQAVIATTEDSIYRILFVEAWILSSIAVADKKLRE